MANTKYQDEKIIEKVIKNWIKQAESDLSSASYNLNGKKLDVASYLCQQAAEKALKSLHIKIYNKLWKTHDLVKLAELVKAPENILNFCNELTPIYTEDRYPDFSDIIPAKKFEEKDVKDFLNKAKEVIKWTKENLRLSENSKSSRRKTKSRR